jgi:xanthine/CO dehydrogenase XdhC/CoxF family maturation factor
MRLARQCEADGVPTLLARLVSVEGSHYRKPGARMLLAADGRSAGAISAGCLESDLRKRLPEVLSAGRTEIVEYDSRSFEDLVWGLGSGCNGLVRILLSPFAGRLRDRHERLSELLSEGNTCFLATALAAAPPSKLSAGDTLHLDGPEPDPRHAGVQFLIEEIRPAIGLLIAGAGTDAVPLARLAGSLGWTVSILSPRDRAFVLDRFRGERVEFVGGPESVGAFRVHPRTAAIVMSHGFTEDSAALAQLLPRGFPYLGVLGPRERTRRLLDACGAPPGASEKLHAPAGIRLGAETPEEIALSIVSEIQAVLSP